MALRPAFSPREDGIGVRDMQAFSFEWNPGFSFVQKQRNVLALHKAIREAEPLYNPLEVSSKSTEDIGKCLSAFNLSMPYNGGRCTVESVFQARKVFEHSGPFPELYNQDPRFVRNYVRMNAKGRLIAFETPHGRWSLNPTRAFYDWIYMQILLRNNDLIGRVTKYNCFTDIEFNPKKSLNCQAYAVALFLSFKANGVLDEALKNKESFLRHHPADIVTVGDGMNVSSHTFQPTFDF